MFNYYANINAVFFSCVCLNLLSFALRQNINIIIVKFPHYSLWKRKCNVRFAVQRPGRYRSTLHATGHHSQRDIISGGDQHRVCWHQYID